ncbi:MAG: glycosyltransferase family 2 protein [Candidatus Hydrogenedentota bacterium]
MLMIEIIFWVLSFIVILNLILYPAFLYILNRILNRENQKYIDNYYPFITILFSAYNEEKVIERRIKNLLSLDYPMDKIEIIAADDGSKDATCEIIKKYAFEYRNVRYQGSKERKGKVVRLNEAVKSAHGEILIFTDANTIYDREAVKLLVRPFIDPRVGACGGDLIYEEIEEALVSQHGEATYWRYETFIKEEESRFYSMVMGAGAIYAVRKELYVDVPPTFADDSYIPMHILKNGYIMVFVKDAKAYEKPAEKLFEEIKRRLRMVPQDVRGYLRLNCCFTFKTIKPALMLFCHKFLRWNLGIVIILWFLLLYKIKKSAIIYLILWSMSLTFIILSIISIIGLITEWRFFKLKIFTLPLYFLTAVFTASSGYIVGICGFSKSIWEKAETTR